MTTTYRYYKALRLKSVRHRKAGQTVLLYADTLDALGNVISHGELGGSTPYDYDRLSRLTVVTETTGTVTRYTYDPVGNRLTKARGTTTSYSYDKADRLTTAGGVSYTFDANGNPTGRRSRTFGYDQANRLITTTLGTNTTRYTYDGDGNRTQHAYCECDPVATTRDVNPGLPVLLDDGDRQYVWGNGLAYAVTGSGLVLTYHADRLGSVRALSDGSGAITQTYKTDEFGIPTLVSGPSSQPFWYTGEQWDAETGLLYLRALYYEPYTGRFISRDSLGGSIGAPQSLHRYSYAGNNPATLTDPSGRCPQCLAVAVVVAEIGLTVLDGVNTVETWKDPEAGLKEKLLVSGLFVVGLATPGGGEATVGRALLKGARATTLRQLTKTERLAEHLTREDLEAARRELAGEVVRRKSGGASYNHVQEVQDAQRGLLKRILEINNRLAYPGTGASEKAALSQELSQASRLLDYSERYVPR